MFLIPEAGGVKASAAAQTRGLSEHQIVAERACIPSRGAHAPHDNLAPVVLQSFVPSIGAMAKYKSHPT